MTDIGSDPFGFLGHLDNDTLIIIAICILLIFIEIVFDNPLLLVVGLVGIVGAIAVQAYRNYTRRKSLYKYDPEKAAPTGEWD